jgi:hypothetical protein
MYVLSFLPSQTNSALHEHTKIVGTRKVSMSDHTSLHAGHSCLWVTRFLTPRGFSKISNVTPSQRNLAVHEQINMVGTNRGSSDQISPHTWHSCLFMALYYKGRGSFQRSTANRGQRLPGRSHSGQSGLLRVFAKFEFQRYDPLKLGECADEVVSTIGGSLRSKPAPPGSRPRRCGSGFQRSTYFSADI